MGQPASEDSNIAVERIMQDFISTETSQTAMACEQAALFGATPGPEEFDNREIWNEDEALAGIEEAIHILAGAVAPDGTQLADERESLLWGFVNTLHAQVQRLDRGIDKIAPEMKDLGQEQDGSEIKSRELELLTDRVQNLGDRRDAFEGMRDLAAEGYRTETGDTWRPRNGSHSSQTGKLTSASIDARDYLRARKDRETSAHLPEGTLVAFTGGKDFGDVTAIWHSLDSIKLKYEDMVLLHGGGPGAEKIAASWAEKNGVHQVVCKPNWDRDGKAAPFRRNDVLLNFLPKGLVAFPGSGITNNLVDKAQRKIGSSLGSRPRSPSFSCRASSLAMLAHLKRSFCDLRHRIERHVSGEGENGIGIGGWSGPRSSSAIHQPPSLAISTLSCIRLRSTSFIRFSVRLIRFAIGLQLKAPPSGLRQ